MGSFEDELRAEAGRHGAAWEAQDREYRVEARRHDLRREENRVAIAGFIDAMGAARQRPQKWRVRTRTLENKKRRQPAMTGWLFRADDTYCFVTASGQVYTVTGVRDEDKRTRTLITPQSADLSRQAIGPALVAHYAEATGGQHLSTRAQPPADPPGPAPSPDA